MTRESATSLKAVSTLVVYYPWGWVLGGAALGWSVPLARKD